MFWVPLLMGASSLLGSKKQNDEIKATNITNKSNTKIANMQQQGNSVIAAAKGTLQRFNESTATRDALKGYGDNHNKLEDQRVKLGEQMTTGSFQGKLAAAHAAGELAARSSAAGVGGSTITMLNATNVLNSDIDQAQMDEQYSNQLFQVDEAEQANLFDQLGITAKQNVYLDDVAASSIVGPGKIPSIGMGEAMIKSAMTYLGAAQSVGQLNGVGASAKKFFGSAASGANSFFQLGGRS